MRSETSIDNSGNNDMLVYGNGGSTREASLCKYFLSGMCNRGPHCSFSHSLQAMKPTCKFFFTLQVSVVLWLIRAFANNN